MNKNTSQKDYENCIRVVKGRHGKHFIQMSKKKKRTPTKSSWAPNTGEPPTNLELKTPTLLLRPPNPNGVSTRKPIKWITL